MTIIFLILKIIGIIILIPLVILAVFLICPIAYRLEAEFDGRPHVKARVRWAFPLFGVKASYEEKLDVAVRVMGIPIYRTDPQKWSLLGREKKASVVEEAEKKEEVKKSESSTDLKERFSGDFTKPEPEPEGPVTDILDLAWNEEEPEDVVLEEEIPGPTEKSRKKIFERFVDFLKKCYNKGKNILSRIKRLTQKGRSILHLLEDEQLRAAVVRIKGYLLRGAGYLMPQKLEGNIVFGLEDPADTGKVLGWIAAAMPLYGDRLDVMPDFNRKVLEGEVLVAGRIRRYKILKLVWDVYRDKDLIRQKDRAVKIVGG